MAAVIFVVTFLIRIPLFASSGYLNVGDVPIYLASWLLGGPFGAAASAIGSALSDLIGFPAYAVPTAIIKGLMGLVCGLMTAKVRSRGRFIVASAVAGAVMVFGYALFEALFFNFNQALAGIAQNSIQWVACVLIAAVCFPAVKAVERFLKS